MMRRLPILAAALALSVVSAPARVSGALQQSTAVRAAAAPEAGWLGIRSTVTVEFGGTGVVAADPSVRISEVFRGGPAHLAGLRAGDVLVRLNGTAAGPALFESVAGRLRPGDPVAMTVLRDGSVREFTLRAARRPTTEVLVPLRLQQALDSTRLVFAARLDSVRNEITATMGFPEVELRRIQADAVQTVVSGSDAGRTLIAIRYDDPVFEWSTPRGSPGQATSSRSDATRPYDRWVFRPYGPGNDSLQVTRSPGPPAAPTSAPRTPNRPTSATIVVRPLAPYLAGLNRVAGAEFTPLGGELATYFQVDAGLLVTDVADGTPAADAGLAPGDVITQVGTRAITSVEALRSALSAREGPLTLVVVRRGRRVEVRLPH